MGPKRPSLVEVDQQVEVEVDRTSGLSTLRPAMTHWILILIMTFLLFHASCLIVRDLKIVEVDATDSAVMEGGFQYLDSFTDLTTCS